MINIDILNSEQEINVNQVGGIVSISKSIGSILSITYESLKTLRDSSKLIPGQQYRIIDYITTTSQENTQSAGHQFDIIVTALDEHTLSEEAQAIQNINDSYFDSSNLSAWKIWYCLDNDTNRFAWADGDRLIGTIKPTTGSASGTYTYSSPIYKIVYGNKAYNLEIGVRTQIYIDPPVYITKTDDYTLVVEDEYKFVVDSSGVRVYTGGQGVIYRMIDEFNNDVPYDFKNIQFKRYKITSSVQGDLVGKYATPDAVDVTVDDSTPYWCYTFSTDSLEDVSLDGYSNLVYNNIIPKFHYGLSLLNNIVFIGKGNLGNRFGVLCSDSTFGNNCYGNIFGNNCSRNTFGGECYYNIFGNSCSGNTFGNNIEDNTFGNYCNSNTFGDSCKSNTFGNDCRSITFGDNCSYNTFGNACSSNTFGDNCSYNTFGNACYLIKFASDSATSTKYSYYRHNHFGDGCQYILFKGADTASPSSQVQNYNFAQGLQGTSSSYLTIEGVRNLSYEVKVAKNSKGEIKIYCEADLIA